MSWNDGYERRKFESKQKKQAEQYRKLGMTEEQITALYEFDMAQYRSDRRYHEHTQAFLPDDFDENEDDEEKLSIFEKFKDVLTTTIEDSGEKSRYWWVEEIDNPVLLAIVKSLSKDQINLVTLIAIDQLKQCEISKITGISQSAISQRLSTIKKILKTTL